MKSIFANIRKIKSKKKELLVIAVSSAILLTLGFFVIKRDTNLTARGRMGRGMGRDMMPKVKTINVEKSQITQKITLTGELVARNKVTISPTVSGVIIYCPYKEGDIIDSKGIKLIEIDKKTYQWNVNTAKANLEVEKAKYEDLIAGKRTEEIRQEQIAVLEAYEQFNFYKNDMEKMRELALSNAISEEEYEKARINYVSSKSKLEKAQENLKMYTKGATKTEIEIQRASVNKASTELKNAEEKLAECTIFSPFRAKVVKMYVQQGDLASVGSPLMEIIDMDSLVVRFGVPEKYLSKIKINTPISVKLDAYPDQNFDGKITQVFGELTSDTRNLIVEGKLNTNLNLFQGMFARITVILDKIDDTLVIPFEAIKSLPSGEKIVFVVLGNKVVEKKIITGIEEDNRVQVLSGINEKDKIVISDNSKLSDGMKVEILK